MLGGVCGALCRAARLGEDRVIRRRCVGVGAGLGDARVLIAGDFCGRTSVGRSGVLSSGVGPGLGDDRNRITGDVRGRIRGWRVGVRSSGVGAGLGDDRNRIPGDVCGRTSRVRVGVRSSGVGAGLGEDEPTAACVWDVRGRTVGRIGVWCNCLSMKSVAFG